MSPFPSCHTALVPPMQWLSRRFVLKFYLSEMQVRKAAHSPPREEEPRAAGAQGSSYEDRDFSFHSDTTG